MPEKAGGGIGMKPQTNGELETGPKVMFIDESNFLF